MEQTQTESGVDRKKREFTYAYGNYVEGGGLFIEALENGELYDDITVNLKGYGYMPGPGQVFIPAYKIEPELMEAIYRDLVKDVIVKVPFGPFDAYAILVQLKDDWEKRIVPLESLMPHEAEEE